MMNVLFNSMTMYNKSGKIDLLLICHCYREDAETIRIISARKATKNESKHYPPGDKS